MLVLEIAAGILLAVAVIFFLLWFTYPLWADRTD